MPTLVAGSPKSLHPPAVPWGRSVGARRLAQHLLPRLGAQGFTLLELLVVMAIIAIASAGVALTLRDSSASNLERDAQRLAAVLESGRAQSRMQGTPVIWRAVPGGFALEGLNPPLPPQTWLNADTVVGAVLSKPEASTTAGGAASVLVSVLVLGPEPILAAQAVVLTARGNTELRVQLSTDGLRPFTTVPPGSPLGMAAP